MLQVPAGASIMLHMFEKEEGECTQSGSHAGRCEINQFCQLTLIDPVPDSGAVYT